ncbi:hypothetical protein [Bacillus sp. Marseille-P3661]|uniref:hypothetical protein n=1 Tax=Bacillus sp. Marseille-P3661 TaxID=1936234 RepID=UPI002155DA22|nr:hypothetical protein [Bacillus sp. Marseille-P3661]
MFFIPIAIVTLIIFIYIRYLPVSGVQRIDISEIDAESIQIVDVRDYNESYKAPVQRAVNLPAAYLKRNVRDISKSKEIHIIALNHLEKNICVRFFRKKGYYVTGYTIINSESNLESQENSLFC